MPNGPSTPLLLDTLMANNIYLPIVDDADAAEDLILAGDAPVLRGRDDEHLACGACRSVLARNTSTRTLYERYSNGSGRLLLKCRCGALNKANVRKDEHNAEDRGKR